MPIPWTDKEVEILTEMVTARATLDDLTRVLKTRSRPAIGQKLSSVGMKIATDAAEIDIDAFKKFMKGRG